MVCIMNEALELEVGLRVLEVGAGTGYHACTLAEVVAPLEASKDSWGHVWTVEIIPQLYEVAKANVARLGYRERVDVVQSDGSLGLPSEAPFDRVLVTASAPDIPSDLINQLSKGGILLIPVGDIGPYQELFKVRKRLDGSTVSESLGGVAFVPLRGEKGWRGLGPWERA